MTLTELIDACGEELKGIVRGDGVVVNWWAIPKEEPRDSLVVNRFPYPGSTPEEAVGNLLKYLKSHEQRD